MKKQRLRVSTTHIILLSFLIAILIGAVLLRNDKERVASYFAK